MDNKNRWEELFDGLLRTIDFRLVKYPDGWGLVDKQGADLGDIESERFSDAATVIDRLEIYINDYVVSDIQEDLGMGEFSDWGELLKTANAKMPPEDLERYHFDLAFLDMVCNHPSEIDLERCCFTVEGGESDER